MSEGASLPYEVGGPIGERATFGLIALQTDETIEEEIGAILTGKGIARLTSRIPSGAEVTSETLANMARDLPTAAGLLPSSLDYDVIAYGCTSGATTIGTKEVASLIRQTANATHVTDPLTAVIAVCKALKISRLGFVTPYIEEVSNSMRHTLETVGIGVSTTRSFGIAEDARVARVTPSSIEDAVMEVGRSDCDAVFVSCTNLRVLPVVEKVEEKLDRPVLASNQVLGWHMMRLAGIGGGDFRHGRVFHV